MPNLTVIGRDGARTEIQAAIGLSLMEALRNAGVDEVEAQCGGCCSCATCHIHVLSGDPGLIRRDEDEEALLDGLLTSNETSRLSCQLAVTAELEGVVIQVAAEE